MMIWKLWQGLSARPRASSALVQYLRVLHQDRPSMTRPRRVQPVMRSFFRWLPLMFLSTLLMLTWIGSDMVMIFVLAVLFLFLLGAFVILVPGVPAGLIFGLMLDDLLDAEQASGRYEHILLTDFGEARLIWSLGRLAYHRSTLVQMIYSLASGVYLFIAALVTFFLMLTVATVLITLLTGGLLSVIGVQVTIFINVLGIFIILFLLRVEFMASVGLGFLLVLWFTHGSSDAVSRRLIIGGVYLLIQGVFYASAVLGVPWLLDGVPVASWWLMWIAIAGVLLVGREGLLRLIWALIIAQLRLTPQDMEAARLSPR
jgi:hypothetical protein